MNIKEATGLFRIHQKSNLKPRSIYSYNYILKQFDSFYGDYQVESIGSDEVLQFLEDQTGGSSRATRRLRYAQLKTFFNIIIDNYALNTKNP